MPIYEYRCSGCGHEKEVLQKMSDAPLTDCPACGKPTLKKLISAAGFHLKGSGWYATDFRGGNKPKGDQAAKADAEAGGKGGENKGGENKGGENKGGENKGGENKGGDKGATGTTDDSRSKDSGSKESKSEAASTGAAPVPTAT